MGKAFEIINHTADAGIIAYAADIKQAFANAALALANIIVDTKTLKENLQRDVTISAEDQESLLVAWLNELIYLFDVEHVIFTKFEIYKLTKNQLRARCFGDKIELSRHQLKTGVKAATYHMLNIGKDDDKYKVRVILDV